MIVTIWGPSMPQHRHNHHDDDALATYNAKRRFRETPEPRGRASSRHGSTYTIQKHDATRLHYDLRLELDGVLLSWAVTKGPSLDPSQKRLAVRTEDHPIDYATFEGTIPEGNYGAGTVLLWDRGTWQAVGDPHDGLAKGKLAFHLDGERLQGDWALVRFRGKQDQKRENWLLIKERDDVAKAKGDVLNQFTTSVSTGRDLTGIAEGKAKGRASRINRKPAADTKKIARSGAKKKRSADETEDKARGNTVAGVHLTHPDKMIIPGSDATKLDIARYLQAAAPHMLPFTRNRPLSLLRTSSGGKNFFQKHPQAGTPDAFRRCKIEEKNGERQDYLYIDNVAGLVAAAQMDAVELHIWGSTVNDIERPTRLVFDLDPGDDVSFTKVRQAATEIRDALDALGLASFPLLSGGKGIHVIAPMKVGPDWDVVKAATKALAVQFAEHAPNRYIATATKARRKGVIFIDYLRNERGSTAVAPFSLRARSGAPVAWPLDWDELKTVRSADAMRIDDASERLETWKSWQDYRRAARDQTLSQTALKALDIKSLS
ncbi:MAG TPA: non-homologous end-joining DNA ligase [Magnetospirillaceae bacterium]|jgi:bifunctional non-homologous end joining protein LigD